METLGDAFILTWVYNNTGGSLLLIVLLHAVQNKTYGIVGLLAPSLTSDQLFLVYILMDAAALLLILLLTRGTLSYRPQRTTTSQPREPEIATQAGVMR